MRASRSFGDPFEAVGPEKQRRVRRAAEGFLARRPELAGLEIALEVAAVGPARIERVASLRELVGLPVDARSLVFANVQPSWRTWSRPDADGGGLARWTRAMIRWRWLVIAVVDRDPRRLGCGRARTSATCSRTASRFPGRTRERVEEILEERLRPALGGLVHPARRGGGGQTSRRCCPRSRRRPRARRGPFRPAGRLVTPVSPDVASATIVSNLEPADAKGYTDDVRAAARHGRGRQSLRDRPGRDRVGSRADPGRGSAEGRVLDRDPDRVR